MDSMMSLIEVASSTVAKQCKVITRMTHALATQGALSASQTNDLLEIQKTISKTIEFQASTIQRLAESRAASKCDFGRAMPATTFPRFRQLPPEIRKSVWEMALPDSRVFMPYKDNDLHIALALDHKPPAIRSACKEAWVVTEENGEFAFGWESTRTHGFWFNTSRDIVFVQRDELSDGVESAIKAAHTQNIATEWFDFRTKSSCAQSIIWARDKLKCRKLIVTIIPQPLGSVEDIHHAQLFTLLDRDHVPAPVDFPGVWDDDDNDNYNDDESHDDDEDDDDGCQQWPTWAKLKKRLKKIQSNSLKSQDRRLVFEGMELLFNKRT
ncbi:hypothetical protein CGCSCA4_v009210 [Colletotrichum siamense]|uniref:2EXR domain-containing protein n=1 Tax=Colletotrichum siamense TaxID=690259 RepID=A0A9P5K3D3_COLSI|nr:hypothetical protein CGCSCA4_v009210 [Colletotrichum siamense]KAF4855565.1 hypothetical protein CGCSCA2_v008953 [Colletotrichum siamense]